MNQQQPPFMPFFFPQPQQIIHPSKNEAPARVQLALEFWSMLSTKVMPRAAVNDISIEWSTPPQLTANETVAMNASLNLLIDYFGGKLLPDGWEAHRIKQELQTHHGGKPGRLIICVACHGHRGGDCELCHGDGNLMVYPSSGSQNPLPPQQQSEG